MQLKLLDFFRGFGRLFPNPNKTIADKFNDPLSLKRAPHKD